MKKYFLSTFILFLAFSNSCFAESVNQDAQSDVQILATGARECINTPGSNYGGCLNLCTTGQIWSWNFTSPPSPSTKLAELCQEAFEPILQRILNSPEYKSRYENCMATMPSYGVQWCQGWAGGL